MQFICHFSERLVIMKHEKKTGLKGGGAAKKILSVRGGQSKNYPKMLS